MNRYYNFRIGRFMTPDPAGLESASLDNPQSLNRYAYVTNSPVSLADPLGEDPWNPYGNPFDSSCWPTGFNPRFWDSPANGSGCSTPGFFDGISKMYVAGFMDNENLGLPPGVSLPGLSLGDLLGLSPDNGCDFGVCGTMGMGFAETSTGGSGTWWGPLEKDLGEIKDWWHRYQCAKSCRKCEKEVKKNTPDPNDPNWLDNTLQTAQGRQDKGLPAASLTVNVVSQSGFIFPASDNCKECDKCLVETAVTGGIPSP